MRYAFAKSMSFKRESRGTELLLAPFAVWYDRVSGSYRAHDRKTAFPKQSAQPVGSTVSVVFTCHSLETVQIELNSQAFYQSSL